MISSCICALFSDFSFCDVPGSAINVLNMLGVQGCLTHESAIMTMLNYYLDQSDDDEDNDDDVGVYAHLDKPYIFGHICRCIEPILGW